MQTSRWAATILAVIAVGATMPPAGPAAASDGVLVGAPSTARPDVVIGPDGRFPVSPTTTFPASATVLLTFTGGRCTGFMISADTVAAPGHCVHSGGTGGAWRTNVVAYPGHDGVTAPYGACAARSLYASGNWITSGQDPAEDYGAVKLACAIGNTTGWYRLGTVQSPTGVCTTTHGYPAALSGQWASRDHVRAVTEKLVYVQHDSTAGQAGSPIFANGTTDPDDWCPSPPKPPIPLFTVLAIMSGVSSGGYNVGIRVTQPVLNNLTNWALLPS